MTTHTSGAADLPEALDAIADSQYLAGVTAGWNAAQANDPNAALRKIHESRAGYLKPLRDAQLAALAAGQAVAPAEPDPTPGTHPPPCDSELFENGVSVGLFDIPKWTAEALCKGIAAATGARVDWHYIAGRVHVKALPAPPAMDGGEDVLDAARYRVLRDADNQLHEGDICVSDDSFNAYFGEDLDNAVDQLRDRARAAQKEGEKL